MLDYSEEETSTTHTITADGLSVLFNRQYNVEVIAVNTQREESSPASISVTIPAAGKISLLDIVL